MKEYVVVEPFQDKEQKHHNYRVGDKYPYGNWEPTQERVNELLDNKEHKKTFIKEVERDESKKKPKQQEDK
ncbi:hypothetical protein [Pontibacillus salipaludis]|uniref:Uncharacterized protein n=1 Tax=Pontibacillus salipaludis TaxID=1697394 RepID=A0ABQ1PWS2_9BACI|nr:hypothetical protein [Pontibacillus salipaludis]GGD05396.1 hypothetical protein GCM10011389_11120 [Pontibacillus salipaludis]